MVLKHQLEELENENKKLKAQKKILINEIKNNKRQQDTGISVAIAEANEARMVNKRLKRQNELLIEQFVFQSNDFRVLL